MLKLWRFKSSTDWLNCLAGLKSIWKMSEAPEERHMRSLHHCATTKRRTCSCLICQNCFILVLLLFLLLSSAWLRVPSPLVVRPPSHTNMLWSFVVVLSTPGWFNAGLVKKCTESHRYGDGGHQYWACRTDTYGKTLHQRNGRKGGERVLQKHAFVLVFDEFLHRQTQISLKVLQSSWWWNPCSTEGNTRTWLFVLINVTASW